VGPTLSEAAEDESIVTPPASCLVSAIPLLIGTVLTLRPYKRRRDLWDEDSIEKTYGFDEVQVFDCRMEL
jgi:hypothetical protein